ncbi:hypothetical protein [Haloplanus salilacus]|uniref:hypothetical protein n=1 Tax=Haloplanus salilacus TaxID=2949994 RepID=UPI0030D579CD
MTRRAARGTPRRHTTPPTRLADPSRIIETGQVRRGAISVLCKSVNELPPIPNSIELDREALIQGYIDLRNDGIRHTPGPNIRMPAGNHYPSLKGRVVVASPIAEDPRPADQHRHEHRVHVKDTVTDPDNQPGLRHFRFDDETVDKNAGSESDGRPASPLSADDVATVERITEIEDTIAAKTKSPDSDDQQQLTAFKNVDNSDDDAVPHHPALDGLPVFIEDTSEFAGRNDPSSNGPDRCDNCGGQHPEHRPLERGVNSIRDGGRDGNPHYSPPNPRVHDVTGNHETGCPACGAKSVNFRKNKEPDWTCMNPNCGVDFSHPIKRPDALRDDRDGGAERAHLYWECRHCGEPTQAGFTGIPLDILPGKDE